MLADLTFAITSSGRPECLRRLLGSLREAFPEEQVLVGDDSGRSLGVDFDLYRAVAYALPYDVGLCVNRNVLARLCRTDLICYLDDDFVFRPESEIGRLAALVRGGWCDLCGGGIWEHGRLRHYEGNVWVEDHWLRLEHTPAPAGPVRTGLTFNFFVARTAVCRETPWDERFKIVGEHQDWFLQLRAKRVRVAYHPDVWMGHEPAPEFDAAYAARRSRWRRGRDAFFAKWGLRGVKGSAEKVEDPPIERPVDLPVEATR